MILIKSCVFKAILLKGLDIIIDASHSGSGRSGSTMLENNPRLMILAMEKSIVVGSKNRLKRDGRVVAG